MRGGGSALGNAPAGGVGIPVEGDFGLSSGEAELTLVAAQTGGCGITDQEADALLQFAFGNPAYRWLSRTTKQVIDSIGLSELNGPSAILADMLDKAKWISRGDAEFLPPALEHDFIVGKQAPQERFGGGMSVIPYDKRHGKGHGECGGVAAPRRVVLKPETPALVSDFSHEASAGDGDQSVAHGRRRVVRSRMEDKSVASREWRTGKAGERLI